MDDRTRKLYVRHAENHPEFWGFLLKEYRRLTGDPRPAHGMLGCDEATAERLALHLRPRRGRSKEDVLQVARSLGLDAGLLMEIVCRVDAYLE
jgi:hypothetical protein